MNKHLEQALAAPGLEWHENPNHAQAPFPEKSDCLGAEAIREANTEITKWSAYAPTPLHDLPEIADHLGVARVVYKDESTRFGLGSFKSLGGAYAVERLVRTIKDKGGIAANLTVTTATDGNHGRSVAWGARRTGCTARIYIHANVSAARQQAMEELGAKVVRVDGNYEASLAACKADADTNGWQIVSDTSWQGYHEIPGYIMAGYSVMATETLDQLGGAMPTHALLPVGVGGLAAGVIAPLWQAAGDRLGRMISVESVMSACMRDSIRAGTPKDLDVTQETLMAGLSCGEVSDLAWPMLRATLSHAIAIGDDAVAPLMRWFHHRTPSIEAGECATSGLAACLKAHADQKAWKAMGFDSDSIILLLGTEGATDPEFYAKTLAAA